jgi:hypothetical protein
MRKIIESEKPGSSLGKAWRLQKIHQITDIRESTVAQTMRSRTYKNTRPVPKQAGLY